MRALSIAATGMSAQETNVEVIANNIANINTTAFKRSRAEFTDLTYQVERLQGVPNRGRDNPVPEGSRLGLGVRSAAIRNLHMQGTMANTGNTYDLAINGRGWFQIQGPNAQTLYTRAGAFNVNADSQLVTADGYEIEPAIIVPDKTIQVTINETGQVYAKVDGTIQPRLLGQLTLATFANDSGLEPLGNSLYKETTASGNAVVGVAGDPGFGKISQSYLESSNVDPVKEITELIQAQRSYEMNSKVITASDEMAQTITKNMG